MTPEEIAKPGTERAEQMALFAWAALNIKVYPQLKWMHAIKNAEKGGAIRGSMAKAEGVKAGVFDIFLPCHKKGCLGLYIEMKKKEKGRVSDKQNEFSSDMRNEGYGTVICYSWIEARDILIEYLS